MSSRTFRQFTSSLRKYPVLIDCNFVVDSANGNGLGLRSLKPTGSANGIASVYMHTSATAAAGNPNPLAGYIVVNFNSNYFNYLGGFSGQVSPLSGTPLTSTTNHHAVVIVSLGTATLAQWQAAGLPIGVVPSVGVAFIAKATGTIGGSAAVEEIATTMSGIDHIEVVGDPSTTLNPQGSGTALQGQMILACSFEGAVTAPADGTVIGLTFYLSNSGSSGLE